MKSLELLPIHSVKVVLPWLIHPRHRLPPKIQFLDFENRLDSIASMETWASVDRKETPQRNDFARLFQVEEFVQNGLVQFRAESIAIDLFSVLALYNEPSEQVLLIDEYHIGTPNGILNLGIFQEIRFLQ